MIFYCGVEKIFRRIAIYKNKKLPAAKSWDKELLLQIASPIKGRPGTVINQKLLKELKEYLRFRHLFRNIYGFELKWERFKGLCLSLPAVLSKLKNNLNKFLEELD